MVSLGPESMPGDGPKFDKRDPRTLRIIQMAIAKFASRAIKVGMEDVELDVSYLDVQSSILNNTKEVKEAQFVTLLGGMLKEMTKQGCGAEDLIKTVLGGVQSWAGEGHEVQLRIRKRS